MGDKCRSIVRSRDRCGEAYPAGGQYDPHGGDSGNHPLTPGPAEGVWYLLRSPSGDLGKGVRGGLEQCLVASHKPDVP